MTRISDNVLLQRVDDPTGEDVLLVVDETSGQEIQIPRHAWRALALMVSYLTEA